MVYGLDVEAAPLLALLRSGNAAFPVFKDVVEQLWSVEGSGVVGKCLVGRKKLPRVAQKVASNYFDLAHVTDLVRGTIRYETPQHLLAASRRRYPVLHMRGVGAQVHAQTRAKNPRGR